MKMEGGRRIWNFVRLFGLYDIFIMESIQTENVEHRLKKILDRDHFDFEKVKVFIDCRCCLRKEAGRFYSAFCRCSWYRQDQHGQSIACALGTNMAIS